MLILLIFLGMLLCLKEIYTLTICMELVRQWAFLSW